MKFPMNVLQAIVWNECLPKGYESIEIIKEGKWINDHKQQFATFIFKFENKCWSYTCGRTGSYHTQYYYDWEWDKSDQEIPEIKQVEKTITVWEKVK
jgi:hypothetical protein